MENLEEHCKKIELNSLDLETIFKFCPDGIVCKDNQLCYVDANSTYIETFSANDFSSIIGKKDNPFISFIGPCLLCKLTSFQQVLLYKYIN